MKLTRKEFLATTLAGAAGLLGEACSSDDTAPTSISKCAADITANHPQPHQLAVTAADVKAGADKNYDIQGAADHNHVVILTAHDFELLKAGKLAAVTTQPSSVGHDHDISIQCS
jgi:hypothetical protein